jgi:hypothetical protein
MFKSFHELRFLAFLVIPVLMLSCSSRTGSISPTFFTGGVQFDSVGTGEARALGILGISNFKQKDLIQRAKLDLFKKHPLATSQNYANVVLDLTHTRYFLFDVTTARISADIVTSLETSQIRKVGPKYDSLLFGKFVSVENLESFFKSNEEVLYNFPEKWTIHFVLNDSILRIKRKGVGDVNETADVHYRQVFKEESKVPGFQLGQEYVLQNKDKSGFDTLSIVGFSYHDLILKNVHTGTCCDTMSYSEVKSTK